MTRSKQRLLAAGLGAAVATAVLAWALAPRPRDGSGDVSASPSVVSDSSHGGIAAPTANAEVGLPPLVVKSQLSATPQSAEAHGSGGAIAAGIIGGLAAGAIIGSAAAQGPYYGPGYYAPAPAYYGGCYWTHQRFWDGWGWRVRRVRVCG